MSSSSATMTEVKVGKFSGGKGWVSKAGAVGVIGTLITVAMMMTGSREAAYSYLLAFAYWGGIALVSVLLLMIFHAFRAKWMTVLRRPLEAMASTVVLFIVLFIPIALKLGDIFPWVNPDPARFGEHGMHLLHHKHGWLNTSFFIARAMIYIVIASFLAWRLMGLSLRQDESGDPALLGKQRKLGTGALPLMAFVVTFAAFDWLMSLDPVWFSTIFGVYYFGGSMLCVLALLILVTLRARGKDLYGDYVTIEHFHNLGKLLFAFFAFWGYIAASQFLLIWIAGLPEETPFYLIRMKDGHGAWPTISIVLIFAHFALPFFMLLSRGLKRRPERLAIMAVWALLVHFLDLFWLIFPSLNEEHVVFPWTLIPAFLGVGGLAIAFGVSRLRGRYTLPVKDPFLQVSLRYKQP